MNPLIDQFHQPLPAWRKAIEQEGTWRISELYIVKQVAEGNDNALRALILNYWPFVDTFPRQIRTVGARMIRNKSLGQYGAENLRELWQLSSRLLKGMEAEESTHRQLWIRMAASVGILYDELSSYQAGAEIRELIELMDEKTAASTILLRFVAVEIVAESLSTTVLSSESFRALVNQSGRRWFEAHVQHGHRSITHEELALRLASTLHQGDLSEGEAGMVIRDTVERFTKVANACFSL